LERAFIATFTTGIGDTHIMLEDKQVEESLHSFLILELFTISKKRLEQAVDRFNKVAGTTGSIQYLT